MARLWNDFAGERKCVILTMAANASIDSIHDSMPLVLKADELEKWIGDTGAVAEIIGRVPPELVHEEA